MAATPPRCPARRAPGQTGSRDPGALRRSELRPRPEAAAPASKASHSGGICCALERFVGLAAARHEHGDLLRRGKRALHVARRSATPACTPGPGRQQRKRRLQRALAPSRCRRSSRRCAAPAAPRPRAVSTVRDPSQTSASVAGAVPRRSPSTKTAAPDGVLSNAMDTNGALQLHGLLAVVVRLLDREAPLLRDVAGLLVLHRVRALRQVAEHQGL